MNPQDKECREFDVAVVGEINPDLILNGNVVPAFGQAEQIVAESDLVMGSSAVIVASGLARLGLRTAFIGKVGQDIFGSFMLTSMQGRGIDVSGVKTTENLKTGYSVILNRGTDRAILTFPGSIPELAINDIDFNLVTRCRHLHLSSYFLLSRLRPHVPELFERAKAFGLTISLDTNYDPSEEWDGGLQQSLKLTDVFLPNENEAMGITRTDDPVNALNTLAKMLPVVAVKMGDKGAMAKWPDSSVLRQSAFYVDVVDTVGAGDSFDAGFIYGFLNQWGKEDTLRLAAACGSISTLQAGGTHAQANLEEATRFIQTQQKKEK